MSWATNSTKFVENTAGEYNPSIVDDDPTVEELRRRQAASERAARAAAQETEDEEEARLNDRRADKARYLREKLEEQEQADSGTGDER
jgi:hypothetical protein